MERSDCTVKQRYYFERVWKRALFSYAKFRKEVQIMNEVQIFNNEEFGQVRIVEIEGKPYFVGKDVANALGYSNPRDAILRHCKGVVKHDNFKEGGQLIALITEGDMYRLITHSKLESAERFEDWVFDEVLPAIRKHGIYATDNVIDNILNNPDFGIQLLTKLKE